MNRQASLRLNGKSDRIPRRDSWRLEGIFNILETPNHLGRHLAEGVGFEPTSHFRETVFKTAALNHSAIPPRKYCQWMKARSVTPPFPAHFFLGNTLLVLDLDVIPLCFGVIIPIMALMSTRFRPRKPAASSFLCLGQPLPLQQRSCVQDACLEQTLWQPNGGGKTSQGKVGLSYPQMGAIPH